MIIFYWLSNAVFVPRMLCTEWDKKDDFTVCSINVMKQNKLFEQEDNLTNK